MKEIIKFLKEPIVITAIVGLLSGIFGSVMATFFAPWVKYKIEEQHEERVKQAEEVKQKRELIAKWRVMVIEIHEKEEATGQSAQKLLQVNKDFLALEPYLSSKALQAVYGRETTTVAGSVLQGALLEVKDDIARIEKEWGLR
jgi:hypothetical protein